VNVVRPGSLVTRIVPPWRPTIVKPGSDLYFVYTHNWVDNPLENRFNTLDRRAASKVLYTHRF
jgi:hypothetical protein